jgi:glycosyltransferase involved in cell wall biosynthesis
VPSATICISPECQRQVETIAGTHIAGLKLQARARYRRGFFSDIKPVQWSARPFRLLFAGRIEENKGVFDLVELMQRLTSESKIDISLEICGDGSALPALKQAVRQAGLHSSINLRGKLGQGDIFLAFQRCHVVIVPTTAGFSEGLNKVVVEGVLSGRPVVATSVCPANEVFPHCVIEVLPGDIVQMMETIIRLANDQDWYNKVCSRGAQEGAPFYDKAQSWGAAVMHALNHIIQPRRYDVL